MTDAPVARPTPTPSAGGIRLEARGATLAYEGRVVARDLSIGIRDGEITTIIGPNGCGKSTLLRALGRLLRPASGEVLLDGAPVARMPARRVAHEIAVLPQSPTAPGGMTVADLVSRGRHARQRWFDQYSRRDEDVIARVLAETGLEDLADAPVDELSGGQRQRAWIAMTLAQDTGIVLLDEPTTFLDMAHQLEVLELVHRLNRELGRTIVMVLHDVSLAARYSDRVVAMRDGRIVAEGDPAEVVTEATLERVFGLRTAVVAAPGSGRPHVIPLETSAGPRLGGRA